MKNYKLNKLRNIAIIVIIIMAIGSSVYSKSSEHKGSESKRIEVVISQEGVNRIKVDRDRVARVIGNEEEYSIEGDSSSGIIFVATKLTAGDMSPITIVTEKGYIQDINLKIGKGRSPSNIVIKKPEKKKEQKKKNEEVFDKKEKVIKIIKEIYEGETRNYSYRKINVAKGNVSKEVIEGYEGLSKLKIEVSKVSEYTNKNYRVIKWEYDSKESGELRNKLKDIKKIFLSSITVAERGNVIIVIYEV